MCFNVYAHNRDDHSKNFSFLYDDRTDRWNLSPAYDLTWSDTYYGEHTTTVNGNGRDPGEGDLLAVGKAAGLAPKKCRLIMEEIKAEADQLLARFGRR
jgi:serine/threonine-protein kinase HipA